MARSSGRVKSNVNKLLDELAGKEDEFLRQQFLAPALPGGVVAVRIGGVVCRVKFEPRDFTGWGVFEPVSHSEALLARQATLAERRRYLQLFPAVRLIVCLREGRIWYGSPASFGDGRIHIEGVAPIEFADEVQMFDVVVVRYDGTRFWFDEVEPRHDPAAAAYLRASLNNVVDPAALDRLGLTPEQRAAYEVQLLAQLPPDEPEIDDTNEPRPRRAVRRAALRRAERAAAEKDPIRARLRENLSHAGAQLIDYLERADGIRVTYRVDGADYTTSVNKNDLTVQVAGICLSGEDQNFDLASLVGVLRESDGHVLRVGDGQGIDEDFYWRVHPPPNG
jgi:hypothetical protein